MIAARCLANASREFRGKRFLFGHEWIRASVLQLLPRHEALGMIAAHPRVCFSFTGNRGSRGDFGGGVKTTATT